MNLTPEHLRASYEIYMKYGNSSSATIISVLNKLRESEGKEQVIACAFGPGIALEMMVLRRRKEATPPINGFEQKDTNGMSSRNGAVVHHGSANGNGVSETNGIDHTNGNAGVTESPAISNGHATTNGTTIETIPPSEDGASLANGVSAADGGNGPASSLPVEDLD